MRERLGLFRLSGCDYAVPLDRLLRVVEKGRVDFLPLMPPKMAGMLIVDDEIVPVLDSEALPGVSADAGSQIDYQVLVATECGPMALPADTTVGIVAESRGRWENIDQKVRGFLPDIFCYNKSRFLVLNVDDFVMDLIRS